MPSDLPRDAAAELDDVLERLGNLLGAHTRQRAAEHGLKEVQLRALVYLARCNRFSDTPVALADFLGLTKGTVSQTVAALESKGLLRKRGDPVDRRVVHLDVTKRGEAVAMAGFPSDPLVAARQQLGSDRVRALAAELRELLRGIQRASGNATFGVCQTCRHLQEEGPRTFRCGLTQEPLVPADTLRICREHASDS